MRKYLSYIVSIGLALVLCYFSFRNISLNELLESSKGASVFWIILVFIGNAIGQILRGLRWKLLLKPLGYSPANGPLVASVFFGYMVNLILPRAGELARCANLQRLSGVPTDKSFGAVVAERVVDVALLLILLVLNVLLEFDRLKSLLGSMVKLPEFSLLGLVSIGMGLILASLIIYIYRGIIFKYLTKISFFNKVWNALRGFKDGFGALFKLEENGKFLAYSVAIWASYYGVMVALLIALPLGGEVGALVGLSTLVIGSVGMAVPSLGGLGSYHLLITAILLQYGFNEKDGMIMATFQHTLNGIIFVVILGVIGFIYSIWKKH